jgi:hypothetical protein
VGTFDADSPAGDRYPERTVKTYRWTILTAVAGALVLAGALYLMIA